MTKDELINMTLGIIGFILCALILVMPNKSLQTVMLILGYSVGQIKVKNF